MLPLAVSSLVMLEKIMSIRVKEFLITLARRIMSGNNRFEKKNLTKLKVGVLEL